MTMMILNVTLIIEQRFQWVERRRNDEAMQPFTSQCRKMVRHTLKILQQMLQDF